MNTPSKGTSEPFAVLPTDITSVQEDVWNEAVRRFTELRPLVSGRRTATEVKNAAATLDIRPSRCYELLRLLDRDPRPQSLLPKTRGRKKGARVLEDDVEAVVGSTINEMLIRKETLSTKQIHDHVRLACFKKKLPIPSITVTRQRLKSISAHERVRLGQGKAMADRLHGPKMSHVEVEYPLELVQLDHTRADIMLIDSEAHKPIGRPWVSFAIDVYSRAVLGFYLSLEAPSAVSLACLLVNAVWPKEEFLRDRHSADAIWPMHGLPQRIHVDNGSDMRSQAFQRGCHDHGIELTYRPPGRPHHGGHIERLIGTFMGQMHVLPGTTGSDTRARKHYDPSEHTFLSLWDLERWLIWEVERYHNAVHKGIGTTPLAKWQEGVRRMSPLSRSLGSKSHRQFFISFLPAVNRKVHPDGIHFSVQRFVGEPLYARVGQEVQVYYNPRDNRCVYVRGEQGLVYSASNSDPRLTSPPRSFEELRRIRRHSREAGLGMGSALRELAALERQDVIVSSAKKTHRALRHAEKRRRLDSEHPTREKAKGGEPKRHRVNPDIYKAEPGMFKVI